MNNVSKNEMMDEILKGIIEKATKDDRDPADVLKDLLHDSMRSVMIARDIMTMMLDQEEKCNSIVDLYQKEILALTVPLATTDPYKNKDEFEGGCQVLFVYGYLMGQKDLRAQQENNGGESCQ